MRIIVQLSIRCAYFRFFCLHFESAHFPLYTGCQLTGCLLGNRVWIFWCLKNLRQVHIMYIMSQVLRLIAHRYVTCAMNVILFLLEHFQIISTWQFSIKQNPTRLKLPYRIFNIFALFHFIEWRNENGVLIRISLDSCFGLFVLMSKEYYAWRV